MCLSIVLSGRNDTYGGDFVGRLNRSLESLLPLNCEIILVEWNPPLNRPPLAEVIPHKGIRIITVSHNIHMSLPGADLFPMFEYRAKNVGIRRADGDWILCLNSDIILSEAMRQRLQQPFDDLCFYRAERHDMEGDKLLTICDGPGDFALLSWNRWFQLRGYFDLVSYTHIDSLLFWNATHAGLKDVLLPIPIIHQEHDRGEHKNRWGIHSSDMPKFIGMVNADKWGLADFNLPETIT